MPNESQGSVNFYRRDFHSELNRLIVELCQRGDRDALREYIRQQDAAHPDRFTDEYVANRPGMQLASQLVAALPRPLSILDVACGNAELLKVLQQAGHVVTGVDVSPVRVQRNRSQIPHLFEGFAEELPLPGASADVAIAFECLEHVMDLDRTLREIHRVLRPGGALLVTVPLENAADGPNHVRLFSGERIQEAIAGRGFHVLLAFTLPYLNGEPPNNVFVAAVKMPADGPALALPHALNHTLLKMVVPGLMSVGGIELTNLCNLRCKQCPTPTTKAAAGFANDGTVLNALDYAAPGQLFSFHRLGEPLLHPKLVQYVRWTSDRNIQPLISTNGLLLTEKMLGDLIDAGLRNLQISFHTTASVEAYGIAARTLLRNPALQKQLTLVGNALSHYEKIPEWLDSCGITSEERRFIRNVHSHNWAGNVPGSRVSFPDDVVARRVANCYFIKNNIANVRWDGTIVACCFDSENENVIGRLEDFTSLSHQPANYSLCRSCDPNWANGDAA
jgi:SAM-dependent methyltransferase